MEDMQQEIIDINLCKILQDAEKITRICDLNESLAANIKDFEGSEPVQDGGSRALATAPQKN